MNSVKSVLNVLYPQLSATIPSLCSTGDVPQGLLYVRQALYQLAYIPSPRKFSLPHMGTLHLISRSSHPPSSLLYSLSMKLSVHNISYNTIKQWLLYVFTKAWRTYNMRFSDFFSKTKETYIYEAKSNRYLLSVQKRAVKVRLEC